MKKTDRAPGIGNTTELGNVVPTLTLRDIIFRDR